MSRFRKCAVMNCDDKHSPRHRFPNPVMYYETFKQWVEKSGNEVLTSLSSDSVYRSHRICGRHFEENDKRRNNLLGKGAVPKLFIPSANTRSAEGDATNSVEEPSPAKKMLPSIFLECHPITNVDDIEGVITEPPRWVERVLPLLPRGSTVVQNTLSDCHSDTNHFMARTRFDRRLVPKTLVCHDYKGGYQGDKYLHYEDEDILGNGYTFYNWAQIDYFVYFSHHFITIPPLCWINTGHKNGVKVLGTLITEFTKGAEICSKKIFKDKDTMRLFARNLAQLTKIFGFDGWLLNIENKVEKVDILKEFVVYLTSLIHFDNPENLVIWYDSVTEKGELIWQNELNVHNRCFFDACDGIFLNYGWDEKHLINTVEAAKHRNLDVFVGIDVFGRNMFGGGQFNTYKAAEMITRYNLSMAIFAPGWTHETIPKDTQERFFKQFLSRDNAFWCSLWPYLYTHPINNYFTTDFYIGLDKSCYNIFNQKHQLSKFLHPEDEQVVPNVATIPTLNSKCDCIKAVAYNSKNTCLISRENLRKHIEYVHHLFVCDLVIFQDTVVYFLTRNLPDDSSKLSITILSCCQSGSFRKINLLSGYKTDPVNDKSLLEVNPNTDRGLIENIRSKYDHLIKEENCTLSVYLFTTPPCQILEIGATIEEGNSIYLRAFGVQNADGDFIKTISSFMKK